MLLSYTCVWRVTNFPRHLHLHSFVTMVLQFTLMCGCSCAQRLVRFWYQHIVVHICHGCPLLSILCFVPNCRWVDDFFGVEPEGTLEHAKDCFSRLVRAMLGFDSIEEAKLQHGNPLTILGVDVKMDDKRIEIWPSKDKVAQWQRDLKVCLDSRAMTSGFASKMAGRFNFAVQNCFRQFGRAMVRPFYAQQYAKNRNGRCDEILMGAIKWWIEVFDNDLKQAIDLRKRAKTVDLFCDASGNPPIMAAVMLDKGCAEYCTKLVPDAIMQKFEHRKDEQIMGLELLAVLMGVETFQNKLKNRNVRVWTDNIGGECALRKQTSRMTDHNAIVHLTWLRAAQIGAGLFMNRVPTNENIADGPTRPTEEVAMSILERLQAKQVPARLPGELLTAGSASTAHLG